MKGAEPHSSEPAHVAASAALFPQSEERYSARKPLSTEEWAARMTPRVEGLMWTAPIFDDRKPQAEPETYCMAIEGGRCNCITEQGTKVAIPVHQCREIVANAGVYNPYRKPRQDRLDWRETRREAVTDVRSIDGSVVDRAAISPGAVASDGLVGGRSSTGSNPMQVPQPANRMDAARW